MEVWHKLEATARFADALDIAVMSVLIYYASKWILRESSRPAAFAIALSLALFALARLLGMYLTLAFFQVSITVILIGLVVIFQQELREWFHHVTSGWGRRWHAAGESVDPLLESVGDMAQDRIGALIVLRGRHSLDPYVRGGVPLDGLVSIPLLTSIFTPDSPGHDGAVILRGDRVERFACHLPLSANLDQVGRGGTRHTAALGLSECCDALILVVSEERGTISVAEHGRLSVPESTAALKTRVDAFYADRFPPRSRRWSPGSTAKQMALRVGSFVTAGLLWFFLVHQVDEIQRTYHDVRVEYRNVPNDWLITDAEPARTSVTLTGPARAFDSLDERGLKVAIDARKLSPGEHQFQLNRANLGLPPGLSVLHADTDVIGFRAIRVVPVAAPIRPALYGSPPSGLKVVRSEVVPERVTLLVPRERAGEKLEISTETVYLYELDKSTVKSVELAPPEEAWFEGGKSPRVRLVIEVEPDDPADDGG